MIPCRKAEFTFCQIMWTQWEGYGQAPGACFMSSGEPQNVQTILLNKYNYSEFPKGNALRGLQEVWSMGD